MIYYSRMEIASEMKITGTDDNDNDDDDEDDDDDDASEEEEESNDPADVVAAIPL